MWSRIRLVQRGAVPSVLGADRERSVLGVAPSVGSPPKPPADLQSDLSLVRAAVAGDAAAVDRFIERISATLWSIVAHLEGAGPEGEAAFLHVVAALKGDGCARLRAYDGRARLSTYLVVVVRDILGQALGRRMSEAPHAGWSRFVRFFERDIRRRVAQQFPRNAGTLAQEDAYQEVCLKLVEDDFHRIRAYGGRGSFAGYVLTIVDRILIDLLRREVSRRRLPAAVTRLSALDQAVFAAIAWEGCSFEVVRLAATLRGRLEQDPQPAEIGEALQRISRVARLEPAMPARAAEAVSLETLIEDGDGLAMADSAPTPEDYLLLAEEERSRAALVAAVKAAAAGLPGDERLYLQIVFSASEPLPAREIAKLMGYPVEDVYRLKQRAQRWMKEVAVQLEKSSGRPV